MKSFASQAVRRERSQTSRIELVLDATRGPSVLDIGCSGQEGRHSDLGSQWWLHGRLLERFDIVWGVEYSAEGVKRLRDEGIKNVHQGDAHSFDLERSFDTIVAGELIEHLENPGLFLDTCRRHIKPGGRLVLTTPYAFFPLYAATAAVKFPKTCSNSEHVMWFCPTTLKGLAERCRFRVIEWSLATAFREDLASPTGRRVSRAMNHVGRFLPARLGSNSLVIVLSPDLAG